MAAIIPAVVSLFGAPMNPASAAAASTSASAAGVQTPALPNSVIPTAGLVPGADGIAGVTGSTSAPFASLLTDAVGQAERDEAQARSAIEGLMSGKGVDVHEAMIATEKAEMGFELVLSVRNKALAAYQQVMGMQF